MTVYDDSRKGHRTKPEERLAPGAKVYTQSEHGPGGTPADYRNAAGYRPGWIWIPLAVLFLLTALVLGTGFIYSSYNDGMRAYDNGTRLENTAGDTTLPGPAATPIVNAKPPEIGSQGLGEERSSIPEGAPPIANDGK